ncbi:MAG: hypothetical protein ACRC8S_16505 [Fimbriiglobus sp.]
MNPNEPITESVFILRRLSDPLPFSLGPVSDFPSALPLLAFGLLGVLAVLLFARIALRRIRYWAIPVAMLHGTGMLAALAALGFPDMALGEWLNASWLVLTLGGLLITWGLVLAMYARDKKTARWWALPLFVARAGVFALLAIAFLLPAIQYWDITEKRSRVVILVDISPSITAASDEVSAIAGKKPPSRMSKLLDTLFAGENSLVSKLVEKNPTVVYRFGSRLDEESETLETGKPIWTASEWAAWANYDFKTWVLRNSPESQREAMQKLIAWEPNANGDSEWAVRWAKSPDDDAIPGGCSESERAALKELKLKTEKRVDLARSIIVGTSVPESVLATINRETGNLVQGLIVISDGRSNIGSASTTTQLRERAVAEKIPVITIAIGEVREIVGIRITDVQAPDRAPPDEAFKIVVEADGIGLPEQEVDVVLGLYAPGKDPKKDRPDHELPSAKLKFAGDTSPPHGAVEFQIDPEKLPDNLRVESKTSKKPIMKQGEWNLVARIAKDKREIFPDPEHISPPRSLQVLDRPTRILLFASGPTRDYQTLRTLLMREVNLNRAELSICLQNEAGRDGTAVQDISPDRMLTRFPSRLDTSNTPGDPKEKYYNLNEYDLIIGFDPDWSELSPDQVKNLQTWVDNLGGGLIYVAGPLNTFQLARGDETGRLKPLLDIMPVIPDDIILVKTRPIPRTPRRLMLRPNPEFDVLRLQEEPADDAVAGWEPFFTDRAKYPTGSTLRENINPTRGFYSYYPLKATKPGATTLAEFVDVNDRGEPEMKPWIVTTQPARGRTVFIGSGETWRFRAFNVDFFDRFWVKVTRFAAGNRDAKASRGRVLIGKEFTSGSQVRVQARILSPNGQPYDMNAVAPKFRIEQWSAGNEKEKEHGPFELKAKKGGGEFDGYYAGQILADASRFPPGDKRYKVVIDVPDSTGDVITGDFSLRKSDPELDNIRPDFAALEQLAGTLEEVRATIKDATTVEKLKGSERDPKKVKLAYRLSDSEKLALLPECFESKVNTSRNRGPVKDLWDRPAMIDLGFGPFELLAFQAGSQRIEISALLLLIVLLLSFEWLTRKLLRMA